MNPSDRIDDVTEILAALKHELYATSSFTIGRERIRHIVEVALQRHMPDSELSEFIEYDLAPSVEEWIMGCARRYDTIRNRGLHET